MKTILFDLDNTLLDRAATVAAFAIPFIHHFKLLLREDVCHSELSESFIAIDRDGYTSHIERAKAIQNLKIWQSTPPQVSELSAYWQSWIPNHSVLMNGAKECLTELRELGFKLGLVTNGQTRNQTDKVVSTGLEYYFDAIVISESVGVEKPDLAIFDIALAELGSVANQTFFIGDHQINDYIGSANAGLVAIWFQRQQCWQQENVTPNFIVQNLEQVVDLITSLTSHSRDS